MRLSAHFFSLLTLITGFGVVVASDGSDVLSLTAESFETTVSPEPLILVEFFAPWCGHCKALAPHYEEAATALKDKKIKLAKVDCVEHGELCQKHGVQGYPTLKVFKNGNPSEYSGPRKADGIISYMVKQSLPAVTEVTAEIHEQFQKDDKIVLIAYLSSKTSTPYTTFTTTAEKHREEYLFGYTTDEELAKAAGVKAPAVVLYRSFDDPRIEFPGHVPSLTKEELEEFIKSNEVPLFNEVNAENFQVYGNSGLPMAYLFIEPEDEHREALIEKLKPVAKKYQGQVNFVWIDAVQYADHGKAVNLPELTWPSFVLHDLKKQLKYPFDQSQDITAKAIGEHVDAFVSGTLEPTLKSEPVPAQTESVITVVGKNFEEVVFDDSKDVFIELYAPWCGHCKRLKPTWDTLGDRYKDFDDRITIAKMDATENDLPPSSPFRVAGFPTIKFKPAGTKKFLDYDGDRSLESLIEYVETHAKNNLSEKKIVKKEEETKVEEEEAPEPEPEAEPAAQEVVHDEKEPHDEL